MKLKTHLRPIALATTLAVSAMAVPLAAQAGMTGNIGVFSQYVLRGNAISPENSSAALQGGFDWSNDSGVYLGYWGSNLGYATSPYKAGQGFENDFYGGYSGTSGKVSYSAGLIGYKYLHVADSDGFEVVGSVGYGPVTLGANYLTRNLAWGNKGDIYWHLDYSTSLPKGFTLASTLSYYTYKKDSSNLTTTKTSNFRYASVTLSHPIAKSGADMSVSYILGGRDRTDASLGRAIVFGVSYGFDIK